MNDAAVNLTASSAVALQAFFATGIVLVCVVLCGLNGLRVRLFRAILFFGSLVTGAITAFVWCDGAGLVLRGFGVPQSWSLVAGYLFVLVMVIGLMGVLMRTFVKGDVMTYFQSIDRLGGALVGLAAGVLLASVVRVGFAMAPLPAAARPSPEQLQVDVTPRVLRMVAKILSSDPAVQKSWLFGTSENLREPQDGDAAFSEPFVDINSNDERDDQEPFLDKDGNGEFTPALFVDDTNTPGSRVGVMDRYWLGDWRRVKVSRVNVGTDG